MEVQSNLTQHLQSWLDSAPHIFNWCEGEILLKYWKAMSTFQKQTPSLCNNTYKFTEAALFVRTMCPSIYLLSNMFWASSPLGKREEMVARKGRWRSGAVSVLIHAWIHLIALKVVVVMWLLISDNIFPDQPTFLVSTAQLTLLKTQSWKLTQSVLSQTSEFIEHLTPYSLEKKDMGGVCEQQIWLVEMM